MSSPGGPEGQDQKRRLNGTHLGQHFRTREERDASALETFPRPLCANKPQGRGRESEEGTERPHFRRSHQRTQIGKDGVTSHRSWEPAEGWKERWGKGRAGVDDRGQSCNKGMREPEERRWGWQRRGPSPGQRNGGWEPQGRSFLKTEGERGAEDAAPHGQTCA